MILLFNSHVILDLILCSVNNLSKSDFSDKTVMHEVRYGVINLSCCRHVTISDEILAVVQNVRSIAFSAVITRLYLQTYNATLIIKNICEFVRLLPQLLLVWRYCVDCLSLFSTITQKFMGGFLSNLCNRQMIQLNSGRIKFGLAARVRVRVPVSLLLITMWCSGGTCCTKCHLFYGTAKPRNKQC